MGALDGIEDFLLAILVGLVVYIILTVYEAMGTPSSLAQVFVLAALIVIGGAGVKLFLRIYSLLYEEEQG